MEQGITNYADINNFDSYIIFTDKLFLNDTEMYFLNLLSISIEF